MQRSSVRRIALPLAALAALPIVVSEAQLDQIEAHKACKHIENTNCHGPCIYWYMSDAPWNDEELIRRANTCFGNGESWEGYTQSIENAEEVVVTGTPVPTVVIRPTPRPIPTPVVIPIRPTPTSGGTGTTARRPQFDTGSLPTDATEKVTCMLDALAKAGGSTNTFMYRMRRWQFHVEVDNTLAHLGDTDLVSNHQSPSAIPVTPPQASMPIRINVNRHRARNWPEGVSASIGMMSTTFHELVHHVLGPRYQHRRFPGENDGACLLDREGYCILGPTNPFFGPHVSEWLSMKYGGIRSV